MPFSVLRLRARPPLAAYWTRSGSSKYRVVPEHKRGFYQSCGHLISGDAFEGIPGTWSMTRSSRIPKPMLAVGTRKKY